KQKICLEAKERPMFFKRSEHRLSMESIHDYHPVLIDDHYDKCDPSDYERSVPTDELKIENNLLQMLNTEYITPMT
ncbi:hypothetical protein BgiBS90_019220, partial [Biomphalaria glabrata]